MRSVLGVATMLLLGCASAPPTRLSQRPKRDAFPTKPKLIRVDDDVEEVISRAAQMAMLMGMLPVAIEKEEGHLKVRGTWLDDWATENALARRDDEIDELESASGPSTFEWSNPRRRIRWLEQTNPKVFRTLTITTVVGEGTATISASVVVCEREREDRQVRCKEPYGVLVANEVEAFRAFIRSLQHTEEERRPVVKYFGPSPI